MSDISDRNYLGKKYDIIWQVSEQSITNHVEHHKF